ncbi:MAG: Ycf66 family protein [Oscillatoriaceae bacterium SKW80]|nr:Ycf66 family protein [Oscillatoriaceae bacterium SKYG93]MCX8121165.1 Ycf66 family protein [Oscillatoriaceae bacterium SKW80]MDW8453505.1 Ycf66 family protein [Oscillatoriaceae cyanobacterium SKYGB_i_bin93]HIK26855.1 Ycf66 family protein [Oscillatoriaceae cyanobacterium M7585_C2015_266]
MVNVGFGWSSLLGIVLAVAGTALYFLRSVQPRLARDHDIFFAAVGLICGGILFFQGWRLDPILQFGQFLLAGSAIFFAIESIRLRGITTVQAKRSVPDIVDEERPISRVYRVEAELDEIEPAEELPERRRIRGTRDTRLSRTQAYEDDVPRRPSTRSRSTDRYGTIEETPRKRRSRSVERPDSSIVEEWEASVDEEDTSYSSTSTRTVTRKNGDDSKPRRSRSTEEVARRRNQDEEVTSSEYVDYQPVDTPDEETDNSGNFDY